MTRHGPVARVAIVRDVAVDWMRRGLLLRLVGRLLAEALVRRVPVGELRNGREVWRREGPVPPNCRRRR